MAVLLDSARETYVKNRAAVVGKIASRMDRTKRRPNEADFNDDDVVSPTEKVRNKIPRATRAQTRYTANSAIAGAL